LRVRRLPDLLGSTPGNASSEREKVGAAYVAPLEPEEKLEKGKEGEATNSGTADEDRECSSDEEDSDQGRA
jgi:hypothetical protein